MVVALLHINVKISMGWFTSRIVIMRSAAGIFLRLEMETILVANWYRPPASDHDKFERLYAEVAKYYQEVIGIFISGDLNIYII